ncbi:hypothetical protein [Prauserella muralis]|uniref:Uncharacterized protein n=1 Tax=Prauserella muralis TaxID=588067 RepID=A0A2V4AN91_9PSEU|nr:hypothetical protein [Prauserella muralis]PXY21109.1 hypothetical protein BAY60_26955 [Prauserella muralis]TWE30194.1 hypothetical protein FHX69_2891 [Prauserella muralis]
MAEQHEHLELTFLGTDPDSGGDNCPNVYATDRGTFVVQGRKITDSRALTQLHERGLPDWETAVEIPASLIQFFPREA